MNGATAISLAGRLPFLLIGIPFAIGNYFLAKRIGVAIHYTYSKFIIYVLRDVQNGLRHP